MTTSFKLRPRQLLLIVLIALLVFAVTLLAGHWWQKRQQPVLQQTTLADGTPLQVSATGNGEALARIILALPPEQLLAQDELLALSQRHKARIVQYPVRAGDCADQDKRLQASIVQLEGQPDLVAGIGPGAVLAWRWLAGQGSDKARALSVGFSLKQPDCAAVLPQSAAHGHWISAWNNNPDDASARFARYQGNGETLISDYDTSLKALLLAQLERLLKGAGGGMPVVEVPARQPADTVTLFYSGDGGWRDLDRDVAAQLAERGYPVVGIDTLRYFWQHKSPQQGAADLSALMQRYREKWGAKHFVLAGFSFGADVLPAIYNQLPASDQQQVDAVLLMAFARTGSFEIEVQGWLGTAGKEAATGPELAKVPGAKIFCVYGTEEATETGCTETGAPGEKVEITGGHHFDGNYPALAERLIAAIKARRQG
jgi:type IV secretory pathway VirJ component